MERCTVTTPKGSVEPFKNNTMQALVMFNFITNGKYWQSLILQEGKKSGIPLLSSVVTSLKHSSNAYYEDIKVA